jgi:hypothetical protein
MPVIQQPQPALRVINAALKAKVIGQPSNEVVQEVGKKFTLAWTFQNVGETGWPLEVLFLRANGDEVESSTWISGKAVAVNEQVTVLVEFTAPQKPGKYFACYRLVHGDNNRFGDKVFLNLTVKDKEADQAAEASVLGAGKAEARTEEQDLMLRSQKMAEKVDAFAEGEDLDNSIVIEGSGAASGDKEEGMKPSPSSEKPLGSALIEEVPAQ